MKPPIVVTKIVSLCEESFQIHWNNKIENERSRFEIYSAKETKEEKINYVLSLIGCAGENVSELSKSNYASYQNLYGKLSRLEKGGFEKVMENDRIDYINSLVSRLVWSVAPHVYRFINIQNVSLHTTAKGYVIKGTLIDKAGMGKDFTTDCILAGGYNIQCLHYRYISNLSAESYPVQIKEDLNEYKISEKVEKFINKWFSFSKAFFNGTELDGKKMEKVLNRYNTIQSEIEYNAYYLKKYSETLTRSEKSIFKEDYEKNKARIMAWGNHMTEERFETEQKEYVIDQAKKHVVYEISCAKSGVKEYTTKLAKSKAKLVELKKSL